MKKYKEFLYGFGIFFLYALFGFISGFIWMFFSIGIIQAIGITYVLCKLK